MDSSGPGPHGLTEQAADLTDALEPLVAIATRAPSVHNTQPWQFRFSDGAIELSADPRRQLTRADPDGREMVISCGAALFGLRLAIRQMGWRPMVELMPPDGEPYLLARVRPVVRSPIRPGERALLMAMRRRHTHRGPVTGEPLPDGLLPALQREAEAEDATLMFVHDTNRLAELVRLVAVADHRQRQHPAFTRELRSWTHPPGAAFRDGLPDRAYPAQTVRRPGALAQRDFDLGRGWGAVTPPVEAPAATAVLCTGRDTPRDWLHAGQALHRLLLRSANDWVFASLHTQPLELPALRAAVRAQLRLHGIPQIVLQLSRSGTAPLTPRRPTDHVITT